MLQPSPEYAALPHDLDRAVAEAIAVCDNDPRAAVRALIVANAYLEEELARLNALISRGYARGRVANSRGRDGADG
jgi:hypothetical protein